MIIVSLADSNYKTRLLVSIKQSELFGYKTRIYDMGGLGFGIKYNISEEIKKLSLRKTAKICLSKPAIMLDALENTDETVIFLDADAFLVDHIDELEEDNYDVGLTYKGGKKNTYLNAGVVFLKQNNNAIRFLNMWLDKIRNVKQDKDTIDNPARIGDNYYLNDLIFSYIIKGSKIKDTVQSIEGIKVKFFDYKTYNNFRLRTGDIPSYVKIVHLRHRKQHEYNDAVKQWLS